MSNAFYPTGGLRFYSEREILLREQFTKRIVSNVYNTLYNVNKSWTCVQVEGPILTPMNHLSLSYTDEDYFKIQAQIGNENYGLRPETTISSYLPAVHFMKMGTHKAPMIIWQLGKSFRRELNDGASPTNLRFNEFYQLELQCIYDADSKAKEIYRNALIENVYEELKHCSNAMAIEVPSDRLPSYSSQTTDIQLFWNHKYKEVCSISTRNDFPFIQGKKYEVLEVAVGMDRLVCIAEQRL